MIVLGLNLTHGDSAACIVKDGKILSAAEEERFTRIKHSSQFPFNSIKFCLEANNINIKNVDYIAVNTKFTYNFIHKIFFLLKNILNFFFLKSRSKITIDRNNIIKKLSNYFNTPIKTKVIFVPHHLAHAYSTLFFLEKNDNNKSIIFSFDGSGDFSTIEIYLIKKDTIELIKKNIFPHSLGLFYTAFTQLVGFEKYGDEYKFMGLAGYGKPIYYEDIKKIIISFDPFKLDLKFFNLPIIDYSNNFPQINNLYSEKLENFFIKKYNFLERDFNSQICKDIASSVQKIFEEIVINLLNNLKEKYKVDKLYLTGGCSFNSLLVGKIIDQKIFKNTYLGPNPGDAGGAIGAAVYVCKKKEVRFYDEQSVKFLGPQFSNEEIKERVINKILNSSDYKINFFENFDNLSKKTAELIKLESIILWFQDNMEWGPRALGNRSILADPRRVNIKEFLNTQVKKREPFRPFAVSILEEFADKIFYMNGHLSPNMNIVFRAKEEINKIYPDIVHFDGTTRVQTVSQKDNKKFYNLLKDFYKITDTPILINTSMNIDTPIVLTPNQAWQVFCSTSIKSLVLNNWLVQKINN